MESIRVITSKEPSRYLEVLTSSDEDEYVAGLQEEAINETSDKVSCDKHRERCQSLMPSLSKDATIEPKGPIEYLAKGKWSTRNTTAGKLNEQTDSDDDHFPIGR